MQKRAALRALAVGEEQLLAVTHDLRVALRVLERLVVARLPRHATILRDVDLTSAAVPARVDHPRAVGELDDLALVALLDGLAISLPRLAVVGRTEERVAVAHVYERVEKRAVLRLDAGAGGDEDESAGVVSLAERPLGEGDVLRDVARLRPRLAVVGRLLHVEAIDIPPAVGSVGVLPVPDVVEKEDLLCLGIDNERGIAAAPFVGIGPRPGPCRLARRPRLAAVGRPAADDVDWLERVEVADVVPARVAHGHEVAVRRGAECRDAIDGDSFFPVFPKHGLLACEANRRYRQSSHKGNLFHVVILSSFFFLRSSFSLAV